MTPLVKPHKEAGFKTEHRGWLIWAWTGWKSVNGKAIATLEGPCSVCPQPIREGQTICRNFAREDCHWLCAFPDNPDNTFSSQWLATKNGKHVYASAPGSSSTYVRGQSFMIDPLGAQVRIFEDTSEETKLAAQRDAFNVLLQVIDEIEDGRATTDNAT